jgi:hypothetical protein
LAPPEDDRPVDVSFLWNDFRKAGHRFDNRPTER